MKSGMSEDGLIYVGDSVFPSEEAAKDVGYLIPNLNGSRDNSNFNGRSLERKLEDSSQFERVSDEIINEAYELIHNPNIHKWDRPNDRGRKRILSRLRELGVPIEPYSKLNSEGSEKYFSEVQRGICEEYGARTSSMPLSR